MSLVSRILVAPALASVLATALFAVDACSSSSAMPGVLGNCVPSGDASCAANGSSGGGGAGPKDSGGGGTQDVEATESGESCGTAGQLLNTLNTECLTCITSGIAGGLSCCTADQACTGQCLSLVQCPAGSINSCAAQYPSGVPAYDDFANCLANNCGTACPTLPLATTGDI
jgi:hypothetical protein